MVEKQDDLDLSQRLADRLERLSADSYWAHQASGLRGALLRCLDTVRSGSDSASLAKLRQLTKLGYWILAQAARELQARRSPPKG